MYEDATASNLTTQLLGAGYSTKTSTMRSRHSLNFNLGSKAAIA